MFAIIISTGYKVKLPDLKKVVADLKDVTEWFLLGISLGIDSNDLKKIESKFKGDIERCKVEMLQFWSENCRDASVTTLTIALENCDRRNLARQIQDKYNVPPTGTHIAR